MKNLVRHHHDGNILILRTNNLLKRLAAASLTLVNLSTMKVSLTLLTLNLINIIIKANIG